MALRLARRGPAASAPHRRRTIMSALYLSRARLRSARGEVLAAVAPLLIPDDPRHHAMHAHRILWLLFQDRVDAERDFLWRDEGNGRYLVLSHRPLVDPNGL